MDLITFLVLIISVLGALLIVKNNDSDKKTVENNSTEQKAGTKDINASARNGERQVDIKAIYSALENYYSGVGNYPSIADLNSATWRAANNMKGLDIEALRDPSQPSGSLLAGGSSAPTAVGPYIYNVEPINCVSPTTSTGNFASGIFCNKYTLYTYQENDAGVFSRTSLN
jgi:hypothetical protein